MRKLLTFAAIAGLALSVMAASQPQKQANSTLKVDVNQSSFKWTGKKVTGTHWGYVKFAEGTLNIAGAQFLGGSFAMDMPTIDVQDLQGEYNGKLVGHLKSDDFFSVDKFAKATLVTKSATPIANAKAGSANYNVVAELTIKGITKEITFPAQIIIAKDKVIANAEFAVDRTLFDIKYTGMADNLIDNNFMVNVRVVATK